MLGLLLPTVPCPVQFSIVQSTDPNLWSPFLTLGHWFFFAESQLPHQDPELSASVTDTGLAIHSASSYPLQALGCAPRATAGGTESGSWYSHVACHMNKPSRSFQRFNLRQLVRADT